MKTVVLDFEKLKHPNCGLGQFCLHLGRALLEESRHRIEPVLFLPAGRDPFSARVNVRRLDVRPWKKEAAYRLVRPLVSPFLTGPRFDLWHVTNQMSAYLPLDRRIPVVLTVHDLNFLHAGPRERIASKLRRVQAKVDRAVAITTVSRFVADELREHLDLGGKPIEVIYNGVSRNMLLESERPPFAPAGPFIFTIGNALPHKNFHVLVDLLRLLPDRFLVIAGNKDTAYGSLVGRRAGEAGLADRVVLPGPISDAHRQWLYDHCEAFAFPSLTEGFGLPVLEAMQSGRPVFLSRATSLPEVGGDIAFYWTSFEPEAMLETYDRGMAGFRSDPAYPARLKAHAARFSWTSAARGYLDLYEKALT